MNVTSIILGILTTLGSLGLFLYGMKIMSEALQKIAGDKMRNILSKMTSRPISGVATGALVTSVIQSSSATTVMTVSFANAGLLSLSGAIAVIMGANIGTTITAWIISIFGLKFSIATIAVPLLALAIPFIFSNKDKIKSIGEFIVGFALLFIGMEMMKNSIPDISAHPEILEFISRFSNFGYWSILLFVLIGTICTIILQSSSAMMAVTLVMCAQGWIGFEAAAALVLGENIGTTITALIAASVANANAKRVALSHTSFNVIGVIWMLILFYPFLHLMSWLTIHIDGADPYVSMAAIPIALSLFHTTFNILNTSLMIWFIPQIEKLVTFLVKDPKPEEHEPTKLSYISRGMLNTAELNLESARREIKVFSERVLKMFGFLKELDTKEKDKFNKTVERIAKYEDITDNMEIEIADFLTKVSAGKMSSESTQEVLSMLRIIDNLESLGDGIFQISKLAQHNREQGIQLNQNDKDRLTQMYKKVECALELMDDNLSIECDRPNLEEAYHLEEEINTYRNQLRQQHLEDVKDGKCSYVEGMMYSGTYSLFEKLGDYIINVADGLDNSRKLAAHNKD